MSDHGVSEREADAAADAPRVSVREADAVSVAALVSTLDQVGERVRRAYNRRGGTVSADAVADAVSDVLTECVSTGDYTLTAADAVRRVSAALKREQRAMSAALGMSRERGNRSDTGRLSATAVERLSTRDRVALANRYVSTEIATVERADAVLAAVTLAALPALTVGALRKRTGGAGASEATVLASHSAESAYLRDVRTAATAQACDALANTYGASGRTAATLARLRSACDAVGALTGESVSVADLLHADYHAPVYVKPRGESVRIETPRRVVLANTARRVARLLDGCDPEPADAVSVRRAAQWWARTVAADADAREADALAPVKRAPVRTAFYGWGAAHANRLAIES